jgi:hypothetical protein
VREREREREKKRERERERERKKSHLKKLNLKTIFFSHIKFAFELTN